MATGRGKGRLLGLLTGDGDSLHSLFGGTEEKMGWYKAIDEEGFWGGMRYR